MNPIKLHLLGENQTIAAHCEYFKQNKYLDFLNSNRFAPGPTSNRQVQMASVQINQCAAITLVCQNRVTL
jgi:hypothetical protein